MRVLIKLARWMLTVGLGFAAVVVGIIALLLIAVFSQAQYEYFREARNALK
jgi:hypothetical protein